MKVLFINQSDYLAPELKQKWSAIVPDFVRTKYLEQLSQKFYELGIPVMHAHQLINEQDLTQVKLNLTQLSHRYNQTEFASEQLAKTQYFKALYYKLNKAHGHLWLESEFNLNVSRQNSTSVLWAKASAKATYQDLEDDEKAELLTHLQKQNLLPPVVNEQFFIDYFTDEQLKHLDLTVRKDEWILCLDETAILQPDFFTKLHNFLELKLSPEILDLAEPQVEQKLLTFVTAQRTEAVSLDPQIKLKAPLLTADPEYSKEQDPIVLSLQQWYEQQLFACLQPKTAIVEQKIVSDAKLRKLNKNLASAPKFTTQATSTTSSLALNLTHTNPQGQNLDFTNLASADLELWTTNYYATNEYKRGYHRYNDKIKSYFYIRVYEGSFGSSGFMIRASTINKLNQNHTTTLSNDLYVNHEFKGLDIAYVRAPWVVGVACPNILPQFYFKNAVIKRLDLWGRKLLCYFKQLKLTASLDTNFKVTK